MDHASAHLIPSISLESKHDSGHIPVEIINSQFTAEQKQAISHKGESHLHNKEQQLQDAYYLQLCDALSAYQDILLFGPTDAKAELLHVMQKDQRFSGSMIETKSSDQMTENQQFAFVRKHFHVN